MNTSISWGKELLARCHSTENKCTEAKELLDNVTGEQRQEVVRFKDEVTDCWINAGIMAINVALFRENRM